MMLRITEIEAAHTELRQHMAKLTAYGQRLVKLPSDVMIPWGREAEMVQTVDRADHWIAHGCLRTIDGEQGAAEADMVHSLEDLVAWGEGIRLNTGHVAWADRRTPNACRAEGLGQDAVPYQALSGACQASSCRDVASLDKVCPSREIRCLQMRVARAGW